MAFAPGGNEDFIQIGTASIGIGTAAVGFCSWGERLGLTLITV